MKKYFILAAAITMAACSNDDNVSNVFDDNVISLSATVSGNANAQTRAVNDATNLQNTQFVNGTTISVQITDLATSGAIHYDLATYTADGTGALTTATPQYYPASGSDVKAYAYHPADAGTTFTVAADQTADANYKASDLMYALLNPLNKTAATNNLAFTHLLSKLVVQLQAGTGFAATELSDATVTLKGVNNQVTFNPETGAISDATGSANITITTEAGTAANAAVVIPQDVAGKKIGVSIAGNEVEYEIPESTTFEAAKVYTYTITVAKSGLTVTSSIAGWTEVEGVSGNITF